MADKDTPNPADGPTSSSPQPSTPTGTQPKESDKDGTTTHAESRASVEKSIEKKAGERAKADVEAIEKRAEEAEALVGETSEQTEAGALQSAGNTGTLAKWENSPAGKAFIGASKGGTKSTKASKTKT